MHTGSLRPVARRDLVLVVVGIASIIAALVLVLARHDAAVPPAEVRVVTVPVPMPIERPAPIVPVAAEPPGPVEPAPARPRIAVVLPAASAPAPSAERSSVPPSASELAALYRDVGHALEKLDRDNADSLWQRYRWIRIGDYLITPQKRAEAAAMLDAIASDARGK